MPKMYNKCYIRQRKDTTHIINNKKQGYIILIKHAQQDTRQCSKDFVREQIMNTSFSLLFVPVTYIQPNHNKTYIRPHYTHIINDKQKVYTAALIKYANQDTRHKNTAFVLESNVLLWSFLNQILLTSPFLGTSKQNFFLPTNVLSPLHQSVCSSISNCLVKIYDFLPSMYKLLCHFLSPLK